MIKIPIEIGDTVYVGRFKNKKIIVKSITYNEYGLPLINGRPLLTLKIEKLMKKESKENIVRNIIREEVRRVLKETYYNPEWKLTTVQSWLDGYAKKNNLPFKLIHKTNKNSNIGRHAKTNTYYVYDIGDKYGIVIRNEKVPGAPRLEELYVIVGVKGTALGSLTNASTLADGSEQELYKMLDKVLV